MARPSDDDEHHDNPEFDGYDDDPEFDEHDDEADDDVEDEDEAGDPEPAPAGLIGRARRTLRPPATTHSPSTDTTSSKRRVDRLDDRERRLSYAAAAGAVVIGLIIYLAEQSNPHFRLAKGQLTPQTTLILGIVCGVLLLAATLFGRRAPVGFVALFTFLFLGTRYFAGVPFLILAVWLLYRSYKFQKEATARAKEARADRATPSPTSTKAADRSAKTTTRKTGTTEGPVAARGQQAVHAEATDCAGSEAVPSANGRPPGLRTDAGLCRVGDQRGVEQLEDLAAPSYQGSGRRLLTEGPQDLHFGQHPDDGGVDGQEQ